jgi:L-ornithine N5-monooxygenase
MTEGDAPWDLLGIGFGPANLALAVALDEDGYTRGHRVKFLEANDAFAWHSELLLPGSRMQISFLKDLVSTHNPTSPFTFLAYLHDKGRLRGFINQKNFYPSRHEFHDYLAWAAKRLDALVSYGRRVTAIEPYTSNAGVISLLRVSSHDRSGATQTHLTRAIVIATGGTPHIPQEFVSVARSSSNIFHTASYLSSVTRLDSPPDRIAIVGGGQSAAEVLLDLRARFPTSTTDLLLRGFALRMADDSPFVNETFEPDVIDLLHDQTSSVKAQFLKDFRHTNYAAIDSELLLRISDLLYQQQVIGQEQKVKVYPHRQILDVKIQDTGCSVILQDEWKRQREDKRYDLVVLATGFERDGWHDLLLPMRDIVPNFWPSRNYRLPTSQQLKAPIFVLGGSERTHGIGDTLLSYLAERAQTVRSALQCEEDLRDLKCS